MPTIEQLDAQLMELESVTEHAWQALRGFVSATGGERGAVLLAAFLAARREAAIVHKLRRELVEHGKLQTSTAP